MIFDFSVNNWRTFTREACLSLCAARERRHDSRVARLKRFNLRLVPMALLFGKNFTGKSNILQALSSLRDLVLGRIDVAAVERLGRLPGLEIPAKVRLGIRIALDLPTMLKSSGEIFQFSVALDRGKVVEEDLVVLAPRNDFILYHRGSSGTSVPERWPSKYKGIDGFRDMARTAGSAELILTKGAKEGVGVLAKIVEWFSRMHFLDFDDPDLSGSSTFIIDNFFRDWRFNRLAELAKFLWRMDTGVSGLSWRETDYDSFRLQAGLPAERSNPEVADLATGEMRWLGRSFALAFRQARALKVRALCTNYELASDSAGKPESYDIDLWQEPISLRRLASLLMLWLGSARNPYPGVIVVDGLGQGFHPMLTEWLLRRFLRWRVHDESCPQLIAACQDYSLMQQDWARSDEIWLCDRDYGGSSLYSLREFKDIANGEDFQSCYLKGIFGSLPRCG